MSALGADVARWLVAAWLLIAVVLALAWMLERAGLVRGLAAREWLWRSVPLAAAAALVLQLAGLGAAVHWPRSMAPASALPVEAVALPMTGQASSLPDQAVSAASAATPAPLEKTAQPRRTAATFAWPRWTAPALLAAWLAGSVLLLLRLGRAAWAVRRLVARSRPVDRTDLQRDLAQLCDAMQWPAPTVAMAPGIDSPMALAGARLLLPAWALSLAPAQRRAMLAHELAHLRRRDPQWRFAMALWQALAWTVPGAHLVRRRLELLAEFACDAEAARCSGNGRDLAECLVFCLEQQRISHAPLLAVGMAAPHSPLLQRAQRLLEGVPMNTRSPAVSRLLPVALAVAAALAVPAVAPLAVADGCNALFGSCNSVHIDSDGDSMRISVTNERHRLRASSQGRMQFTDDERDVASMDTGATLEIEETRDGVTRRVELRGAGGKVERRYYRDGSEVAANDDLRAWLAQAIPDLMRETGMDAERRVGRLLARGGVPAVLGEVEQIRSDYVRAIYLKLLVKDRALDGTQLDRVLKLATGIGSDFELRQVLAEIDARQKLDAPQFAALLEASKQIGSDFERAELLIAVAERAVKEPAARDAWFDATNGIGSDFEKRRTLGAATVSGVDEPTLAQLIAATADIDSDFEKRVALTHIASISARPDAIARPYADAVQRIGSAFEQREALIALVSRGPLASASALAVLDAVERIGSDFESRQALVALAQVMPADDAVLRRYHEVAAKLSDFERGQAERAVRGTRG